MESLLWFAIWAGLFFLMMRFGCGAHVMGHGHGQHGGKDMPKDRDSMRWIAPASDVDPVCRKTVNTESAKSAVYAGTVYYFCSNECRDRFEAAPQRYVEPETNREAKQMEHSHG